MSLSLVFVVTHLQGIGHLQRTAAIARAAGAAGHRALVISGGRAEGGFARSLPAAGVGFVQLPPLSIRDDDFSVLFTDDGAPASEAFLAARQGALLAAVAEARPDGLVTELFPFGRRQLRGEFTALLNGAGQLESRPLIACSVRDIPEPPKKSARAAEADALFAAHYALVLVHGDPAFVPLESVWPVSPTLAHRLAYTGYVDPPGLFPPWAGDHAGPIVVSGGNGAIGLALYRAALGAAALLPGRMVLVLVGARVSEADFASLRAAAPANAAVERARPDFAALLVGASVSVSLGGYNTMLEVGAIGVPALIVPHETEKETEQRRRAEAFAREGVVQILTRATLTPEALASAIANARPPADRPLLRGGAARTIALLAAAVQKSRGGAMI